MFSTINASANIQLLINCIYLTEHVPGEIWECGVYMGGSAAVINEHNMGLKKKTFRLFDTFGPGIPTSGALDAHQIGDFNITYEDYSAIVDYFNQFPEVYIHRGIVPDTFKGLESSKISLCHIDLDQYDGYKSTLEFVYPRMANGGVFMLDDYDCSSTPGATVAVDEFCEKYNQKVQASGSNYGGFILKNDPAYTNS
jgi:hypothetical protein